jgi:NTE family protein
MASACLPQLFQAVKIDGAPYWDGGYTGNPALFPLFQVKRTRDVVIVQLNPIEREDAPQSAPDILARINEITFNSNLLSELRAIEFVTRLLEESRLPEGRYRKMLIHNLSEAQALAPLGFGVDLNTDLSFFEDLFASGRAAAERWLGEHFGALGQRSTVDLRAMFHPAAAAPEAKPLR